MTNKYKVLFLCRDNSIRSIIAEALLHELAGHRFDAFSAGPEPAARIHPQALAQLQPGIAGRTPLSPKSWLEFTGEWAPRMDIVIALDKSVDALHAPAFPGQPLFLDWSIADPLAGEAAGADDLARLFDKTFWQTVQQVNAFIAQPEYARHAVKAVSSEHAGEAANAIGIVDALSAVNTASDGGSRTLRGATGHFEAAARAPSNLAVRA
ncbi:low molecular weight phosphatase family protein [Burkholderia sp. SRS-W-2-2016]|uniref:arsenate-mycothiol transferase ArsC n=1 Tax=Burkholderia sp. SRS-W-2-2016 TaxID=1926878 RepID=UPI00094B6807|nr:low molecular weight phosphatase family protein [Burkholderia sp. SRS-W-2-2016]OLL28276.1 low molecular weight phosphatase family protein [Burkholderia sp. SRS-W-2-2016]